MRKFFLFILLQIVTLYSVSAHCHFVMDNADEWTSDAFSDHCIDDNILDFECGDEFHEDTFVFCEEVARTRRPEDYKTSLVEIGQVSPVRDPLIISSLPHRCSYPRAVNSIPLSSCYSFIVRLTPF